MLENTQAFIRQETRRFSEQMFLFYRGLREIRFELWREIFIQAEEYYSSSSLGHTFSEARQYTGEVEELTSFVARVDKTNPRSACQIYNDKYVSLTAYIYI